MDGAKWILVILGAVLVLGMSLVSLLVALERPSQVAPVPDPTAEIERRFCERVAEGVAAGEWTVEPGSPAAECGK